MPKPIMMKKRLIILFSALTFLAGNEALAQDDNIETVFGGSVKVTGYGALTNEFTTIRGGFANMTGAYGGVYLNSKFLIGVSAAAVTNNLPVPLAYSVDPTRNMSYEYGQVGMINEYVINSNKAVHFSVSMFTGAGFSVQYQRYNVYEPDFVPGIDHDEDWFLVLEPGAQVEVNILRWMRFSPGISYRKSFGADAKGITDSSISNMSYNLTLKFGKF
jgi:hypothetical protein